MTSSLPQLASDSTAFIRSGETSSSAFDALACRIFAFQFQQIPHLRNLCAQRGFVPARASVWKEIPAVPTQAFKELELTAVPPSGRVAEFHSSGSTAQVPSRHFHSAESLAVYETSLLRGIAPHLPVDGPPLQLVFLTPPPEAAPHSSLVHMFDTLRRAHPGCGGAFFGAVDAGGAWQLRWDALVGALNSTRPIAILGTAFNFVHLLDSLAAAGHRLSMPRGSMLLETGGYKGRSRTIPREELHAALSDVLNIPQNNILREYGMSELSSQAYDSGEDSPRLFRFPPWARFQILSPETGREVPEGMPGLLRVCDLANVASAVVVQTEDLAIRRGDGFELLGRAAGAVPRGCSLMTA